MIYQNNSNGDDLVMKGKQLKVIIQTDNLFKYYGKGDEIKAVDELDLEVYEGETFGLLGPNGAGKTTTVRLLNCIIKPTGGTATVNGYDILKQETEVKRITGLLAESPGLYEKLSGYEFLEFVGALYDVPNDVLSGRIDDLLKLSVWGSATFRSMSSMMMWSSRSDLRILCI